MNNNHVNQCVGKRLQSLRSIAAKIQLYPMEPNPYPDFAIMDINNETAVFIKRSSDHRVEVPLRNIADISYDDIESRAKIRVLGRVAIANVPGGRMWKFLPSRIGRPRSFLLGLP